MIITIDINPNTAPRMTQADRWKKRPCVLKYFAFREELVEKFPIDLPTAFDVCFIIPMPKSWSKKKRAKMVGQPHQQPKRNDRDNLLKAFQDALSDADGNIYLGEVNKFWGERGQIEIRTRPHENYAEMKARWQNEEAF